MRDLSQKRRKMKLTRSWTQDITNKGAGQFGKNRKVDPLSPVREEKFTFGNPEGDMNAVQNAYPEQSEYGRRADQSEYGRKKSLPKSSAQKLHEEEENRYYQDLGDMQ